MPRTNYPKAIRESENELAEMERKLRRKGTPVRVRMLRLLKTGQARSLPQCVPLLGYSRSQLTRWWGRYRAGGVTRLLEEKSRPGRPTRLHAAASAGLETEMRAGRIATLADARRYLTEQWQIEYQSLTGVWWQLRRRGARLKTGRRRHVKADPAAQESFQSGLSGATPGGRGRGGLGVR